MLNFLCVLFFKAWRAPHLELAVRNIKPDQTLAPKRKTAPELLKSHCQHVNKDLVGLVGRSVLFTVDGASSFPSPLVFLLNTPSCHSDIKFSNFRDHKRAFFPNVRILLLKRLQSHWLKGILWHIFCHYYNVHNVQPEVWFTEITFTSHRQDGALLVTAVLIILVGVNYLKFIMEWYSVCKVISMHMFILLFQVKIPSVYIVFVHFIRQC